MQLPQLMQPLLGSECFGLSRPILVFRVERFLSQPFFVAEVFTRMAGQYVGLITTVKCLYLLGFTAVLSTPTQAKPTPQDQHFGLDVLSAQGPTAPGKYLTRAPTGEVIFGGALLSAIHGATVVNQQETQVHSSSISWLLSTECSQ